ncbi:BCCT family transporter [Desertibacillus haloalkaliphilus]|uniref:BCCT family transporter n=1 Tax=Desertibacillus haloalkaliphilus TaxID=1328930 RepID=UPI0028A84217|nr:BCCT family transporter [Desertibacillus haloalkaliphilus]
MYRKKSPGTVFILSVCLVIAFLLIGVVNPEGLFETADFLLIGIIERFGWFYMVATAIFVVVALYLAFGRFKDIKLGKQEDHPEYSFYTWIGMLFSAGLGVGFVFWGVAEPVLYYIDSPAGITPQTGEAAEAALRYSVFHWALHPWAIFALVGLVLAFLKYKKDQPPLISSAFIPLLGERATGPIGKSIDVLAVLATATGVATTFGLSALQVSGGLSYLTNIPNHILTQLSIIAIVSVLFMFSAATGVNKGIRYLSITNLTIASVLLVFIILIGPTVFIFDNLITTIGGYLHQVIPMSMTMTPFTDSDWLGNNTIFYWAWHITWAPFMGIFIARISRGRTIKEYIFGVLVVPSAVAAIWFTAFGGSALYLEIIEGVMISDMVRNSVELALFATLGEFPLGTFMSVLGLVLIIIFFITSADSATYVLGSLTSHGSLEPTMLVKVIWGGLIAGIAGLLLVSGGLEGLQTASILAALPFTVVMLVMMVSMFKLLNQELKGAASETQEADHENKKLGS